MTILAKELITFPRCLVAAFVVSLAITGCVTQKDEPPMVTGKVLTREALVAMTGWPVGSFNKPAYAEVSHDWLRWKHRAWKKSFVDGVFDPSGWSPEVLCTTFTTSLSGAIGYDYFSRTYYNPITRLAKGPAVIEYWYQKDTGAHHALLAVVTERGLEFLETQTHSGDDPFVKLSATEQRKLRLAKAD